MSIEYSFCPSDQILEVVATGVSDDVDEGLEYAEAIIKTVMENGCRRLLCDERNMKMELGTVESFNHAEYCARFVTIVEKAAFLPHAADKEIAEFWTTAINNRGGNARIFYDKNEARAWLEEDLVVRG